MVKTIFGWWGARPTDLFHPCLSVSLRGSTAFDGLIAD